MFTIPKAIVKTLGLYAGQQVSLSVQDRRLIIDPKVRPRYALAYLLAQCDFDHPIMPEDREWIDTAPTGGEVI